MYSLHQTVKLMLIFTDMPSSCSLAASYSDVTAYVKPGTCTKFAKCAFCSLFFLYVAVQQLTFSIILVVLIGRLVPTAQYYPLRFLCIRELNKLSLRTSTHVPVLPFLMEVT